MEAKEIFSHVDHTLLKADCSFMQVDEICREALEKNAASACIPPAYVSRMREQYPLLTITTVIGFPLGYQAPGVKAYEAARAVEDGANELDVVIDIAAVKDWAFHRVQAELEAIRKVTEKRIMKVIVETCYLTAAEKQEMCRIVRSVGADYIKTSTGFGSKGAALEDIALFRDMLHDEVKIKAAGGIRTREDMEAFLAAGCDRIGSSSAYQVLFR